VSATDEPAGLGEPGGERGRRGRAYTLITPGNHYVSRLPLLPGAGVVKLVTPRLAPARFGQYLLSASADAVAFALEPAFEHFLFGLDGDARAGGHPLGAGYAYLPEGGQSTLQLASGARVIWIKRRYEPAPGVPRPNSVAAELASVPAGAATAPGLTRRELLPPGDPAFDFNISLIAFEPGAGLPQIEIHDEEHGLWMMRGAGAYHLDGEEHPVAAGDFIYMAPYCPQGFRAGAGGAEYLLYKDVWRDGF
jgi:(S)-ureidoglycine aminohydrolase